MSSEEVDSVIQFVDTTIQKFESKENVIPSKIPSLQLTKNWMLQMKCPNKLILQQLNANTLHMKTFSFKECNINIEHPLVSVISFSIIFYFMH
jgi:hypothetical protein